MKITNIARDFSMTPAGRYYADGPDSGERFRDEFLEPPLLLGETIVIEIDGTGGFSSSFLEEAFGGIVRKLRLDRYAAFDRIRISGNETSYKQEIAQYLRQAAHDICNE